MKKELTSNALKIIAISCMLVDHIAYLFVDYNSVLGIIMHTIGRLTFPILAYMLVEGFFHTNNKLKYWLRLFVFAIISHFAFFFFTGYHIPTSVLFTLLCGFTAMVLYEYYDTWDLKLMSLSFLLFCSALADWSMYGFSIIMVFYFFHKNRLNQFIAFLILFVIHIFLNIIFTTISIPILICQLGMVLAIPVLFLYNGEKGSDKPGKYFFYLFYPLHLVILKLIYLFVI